MAKANSFQCTVITPEQKVLECDATLAVFPAHDGELGVLTHRAPLVCKLGIGTLRVEGAGERHVLFIDGGFAQVVDNRLTLLTEQARRPTDLDASKAEVALIEARAMRITDQASLTKRTNAIARARVQMKLAKG
jgi:F-type H+-transporting ATPase subunit epsilon